MNRQDSPQKQIVHSSFLKLLFLCVLVSAGVILWQYISLKHITQELSDLREDYRSYVVGMKRILKEKASNDQEDAANDTEVKKNSIVEKKCSFLGPYSACSNHPVDRFIIVNRDERYLRMHALHYQKEKNSTTSAFLNRNVPSLVKKHQKRSLNQVYIKGSSRVLAHLGHSLEEKWDKDFVFGWPIEKKKFWISSRFGPRKLRKGEWRFHYGLDMAAPRGTPVLAAAGGIVVQSGWNGGYGKSITIMHNKKYKTRYAHLSKCFVEVGTKVKKGSCIGAVGATGFVKKNGSDASHLHFEVYSFQKRINPISVLS